MFVSRRVVLLFMLFTFALVNLLLYTTLSGSDCIGVTSAQQTHEASNPRRRSMLISAVYSIDQMPPPPRHSETPRIPRILHRMWKSWDVPAPLRSNITSWSEKSPHQWTQVFWTDRLIDRFVRRTYPQLHPWFVTLPSSIYRSDVARYLIMHTYGGVYADLDVELVSSLEPLLKTHAAVVSREPELFALSIGRMDLLIACNAVLMSIPGHPFWPHVVHAILTSKSERNPVLDTGPVKLTSALTTYTRVKPSYVDLEQSVFLAPPSYFYPSFAELYPAARVEVIIQVCNQFLEQVKDAEKYPAARVCLHIFRTKSVNWEFAKSPIPPDQDVIYTRHHTIATWSTMSRLKDDTSYRDFRYFVKDIKTFESLDAIQISSSRRR